MVLNNAAHCGNKRRYIARFNQDSVNTVVNALRIETSVAHDIRYPGKLALNVRPAHPLLPRRGRDRGIILVEDGVNIYRSGIDKTLIGHVWHTLYQVFEFRLVVIDNPTKDIDVKRICISLCIKCERRIRKSVNAFLGSHLSKENEMNRIPHGLRLASPITISKIRQVASVRAT